MSAVADTTGRHIDQNPPYEWTCVEHDGTLYVVHDVPEGTADLYVVEGATRNVRVLASATAALFCGSVVWPYFDDHLRAVEFVHDFAGTLDRRHVTKWLDDPAVVLEPIRSGSGDLRSLEGFD